MPNNSSRLRLPTFQQAIQSPAFPQALILLLALGLRLWGLGDGLLWIDEAMEFWVATSNLPSLLANVRLAIQDPPFYSLILHFWMLPNQSEAYLRLPSVFFSLLSVWAVMHIARQASGAGIFKAASAVQAAPAPAAAGQRVAILAGLLMAVLPAQVRYGQEIGQYAPMGAFLALSMLFLQLATAPTRLSSPPMPDNSRPKPWSSQNWRYLLAWLVTAILAVYTYYGALLATAIPFGCELLRALLRRDWQALKKLGLAALAFTIALLPLLLFFLPEQLHRGPTTAALQNTGLSLAALLDTLTVASARMLAFQLTADPYTILRTWYPALAALLLLTLAIFNPRAARRYQVLVWFVSIWLACVLAAQFNLYPFGFRYSLILTPVLVPLLALGLDHLYQRPALRWAGGLLTLLLMVMALLSLPIPAVRRLVAPQARWGWPENSYSIRSAMDYWRDHRAPGEYTYIYYASVPTFHYYLHRYQLDPSPPIGPFYIACWEDTNHPACRYNAASANPARIIDGSFFRYQTAEEQYNTIRAALPPNAVTFWMVFTSVYGSERTDILNKFQQDYQIMQEFDADNIWFYQFKKVSP